MLALGRKGASFAIVHNMLHSAARIAGAAVIVFLKCNLKAFFSPQAAVIALSTSRSMSLTDLPAMLTLELR